VAHATKLTPKGQANTETTPARAGGCGIALDAGSLC
jgi:hypothetical protein